MTPNELSHEIIGAAIEVHRELGPGKPEAAYQWALGRELELRGLVHQAQKPVPVVYKGIKLECGYRLDLLVADTVVLEVKAVEAVIPVHRAQTLTYLKLGSWRLALLLNFNVAVLKEGIERLVLRFEQGENPRRVRTQDPREGATLPTAPVIPLRHGGGCGEPETERLAAQVLAGAFEVHRELGPGLLPSAYEECLCHELHLRGVAFERQWPLELRYKGIPLAASDEVGLLIEGRVVVSPQALAEIQPVHEAQLLSQLRLGGWKLGLLLNFNTVSLGDGLRRFVLSRGK